MTAEEEVQQLLGDAATKLSAGSEAPADEVVGEMINLLGRMVIIVQHLAKRVDELSESA